MYTTKIVDSSFTKLIVVLEYLSILKNPIVHVYTWYGNGLSPLAGALLDIVLVVEVSDGSEDVHHRIRENRHQDHTHHQVERRLDEDEPLWVFILLLFFLLQYNGRLNS